MEKYIIGILDAIEPPAKGGKDGSIATAPSAGGVNPAVLVAIIVAIAAALYLLFNP